MVVVVVDVGCAVGVIIEVVFAAIVVVVKVVDVGVVVEVVSDASTPSKKYKPI